jgi:lysozyme
MPPVIDIEATNGCSREEIRLWLLKFIGYSKKLFGKKMIIYTNFYFWRDNVGFPSDGIFSECPLWIAGYVPFKKIIVPGPWNRWTFWQFTDGTHNNPETIPGIVGPCDQNYFWGDAEDLAALCSDSISVKSNGSTYEIT